MERSAGGQAAVPTEISDSIPGYRLNTSRGADHFSNEIVEGIRNEEVPGTVGMHIAGNINCGVCGWTSIAAVAKRSIPRDRLNVPRSRNHFPNVIVEGIADENVSRTVDEYSCGKRERRTRRQSAVPAKAARPVPGHGLYSSGGGHDFSDTTVVSIRNENVAEIVYGQIAGVKERGVGSRAAVSSEAIVSSPCYGPNASFRGNDFPYALVEGIDNEDVTRTVDKYCRGARECSARGRTAVSAESKVSISRDSLNIPCGGNHFPNALIARIRDED